MRWRWDAGEALPAAEAAQYVQIWGRRIPETELAIPIYAAVQRGETAGSRAVRKAAAGRTTGGNDRRGGRSDFGQSEAKKSADAVSLP